MTTIRLHDGSKVLHIRRHFTPNPSSCLPPSKPYIPPSATEKKIFEDIKLAVQGENPDKII